MSENITKLRRGNLLALYQEFAHARLNADPSAKGLEQAFAKSIEVSPSTWSMIKSSRPIGDKLARQIESHAGKHDGWLDEAHEGLAVPDPAEERFLELARKVWRGVPASARRDLARMLKEMLPYGD